MNILLNELDAILESLISSDNLVLYEKWMDEYGSKKLRKIHYETSRNSSAPTFETNLICLLFEKLKDKDPHCEWPYKSHVQNLKNSNHADIVFLQLSSEKLYEVWVELKMFDSLALWNKNQYSKDFEKLKQVIDANPLCVGVCLHFDIKTRKKDFLDFFESIKEQNKYNYHIDYRIIGDKNNFHFVRLAFMQKA